MKGQNYTTITDHKSKTIVPYVMLEVNNIMYIVIPIVAGTLFSIVMSVLLPALIWVWIFLGLLGAAVIAVGLSLEDEKERRNMVLLFYYRYIRKYAYVRTAEGEQKVLKKRVIQPYYQSIKIKKRKERNDANNPK